MTVVEFFTESRIVATSRHWWDLTGIGFGALLVTSYVTGVFTHLDVLLYAGLIALAGHAYVSAQHIEGHSDQVVQDETVLAYRTLVATRQWDPSGKKTHERFKVSA